MSLRDDILARLDLAAAIEARDCEAIAAAMSIGRVRLEKRLIGIGTVLDALGPDEGAPVLAAIESLASQNLPVKYGWVLLQADNLDISLPSVRLQFDKLAQAGVISAAQLATIKGLAEVPDTLSPRQVAEALFNDDGSAK